MHLATLQTGGGLPEVVGGALGLAASLVLLMMVVALGAFAYKSLRGDGIEWPEDREDADDDEVRTGSDDDEWDYY